MEADIRWEQRFSNYKKALQKFNTAIDVIKLNAGDGAGEKNNLDIDEMLREGLIQRFEYTHELAWNVMKDYARFQGNFNINGSRDATQDAFKTGIITDGEVWMDMIRSRNKTSHTYNEEIAHEVYNKIVLDYHKAFNDFNAEMDKLNKDDHKI